jgi:hypothetical protein
MKLKLLINPILYAISLVMGISIIVLSYFMDFSCSINIRYLIVYITIAILCLTLAGINSIKNK